MRVNHRPPTPYVSLAVLLLIVMAACRPQPPVTPTPTRTPGGPLEASSTPTSTETPPPPTPIPTATPPAFGPYGPDSYPADVNPLTGMPAGDASPLARAPLAVKVANAPLSRPQSGISMADLVFEHYAEGNATLLTAVFYGQAPEIAGPLVRGRLIDLEIPPMFDTLLVASGFGAGVQARMEEARWAERNFSGSFGYGEEPYERRIRREGLAEEYTLFADPAAIRAAADEAGVDAPPDLTPGWLFDGRAPSGGTPAGVVSLDYGAPSYRVDWTYDSITGRYARAIDGEPHVDYLTGDVLTAANVIVVGAMHVETDILEDSYGGLWSVEIQVWGEGPLTVFRDGIRYEGGWTRDDPEQMLQLYDGAGDPLALKPGPSWIEVVPIGFDGLSTATS
jgi:hypothetical protein